MRRAAPSGPVDLAAAKTSLRVCPRCGRKSERVLHGPSPIEICPSDGVAFVTERALQQSGRDSMLGQSVAGRYTVVDRLGAGAMGAVYRAWQNAVGRWVALKIMRYDRSNAETRARFEREARALSQLRSPHTVTIYDFGLAADGSVFLAMELLQGESLGARLKRAGRLSIPRAVRIAREALLSLGEAHTKGIIHRDLKPDNLFLAQVPTGRGIQEVTKLLDFGIAKLLWEERKLDALETQAGTVFGTPRYMSPEQAQGKPLDRRSDLYSLGVILYHMVVGHPPFEDSDAVVVMARHIKDVPREPSVVVPEAAVPPMLERVIMRALAKEPMDRPPSAEAFARALEAAEATFPARFPPISSSSSETGETVTLSDDLLPTLPPSAVRRRKRLAWVLAGVVSGAVVAGWVAARYGFGLGAAAPVANAPSSVGVPPLPYRTGSRGPVPVVGPVALPEPPSSTTPVARSSGSQAPAPDLALPAEILPVAGQAARPGSVLGPREGPRSSMVGPSGARSAATSPQRAPTSSSAMPPSPYDKFE